MVPLLCGMDMIVAEVKRAAAQGHRGVVMFALPSLMVESLPHISEPYWYPLWDICQELEMPVHFHGRPDLRAQADVPRVGRIHAIPTACGIHRADVPHGRRRLFPIDFLGHRLQVSALEWVSRNRHRLG